MTNKIPKIGLPQHSKVRNAFDLSARHNFTAPLGMLVPLQKWHCEPDDYFEINVHDFMRTMPMNSAAFVDAKATYEFFFVPYHQLFSQFDQMITSMNDYHSAYLSSRYQQAAPISVPTITMKDYVSLITGTDTPKKLWNATDMFGFPIAWGANRMSDLLGYGSWLDPDGSVNSHISAVKVGTSASLNLFPFLAYQKIYQDIYRNTQYEQADPLAYNIDNVADGITAASVLKDWFTPRYRNYGLDLLTNVRPSSLVSPYLANPSVFLTPHELPVLGSALSDITTSTGNGVGLVTDKALSAEHSGFSISNLRAAFAYEKLLDYMNRAPKTYADQMKAIFGITVPVGRDHKVQFVGGCDSAFQIGDVNQVSQTGSTPTSLQGRLGSSTGKMTGSGNGHIKFHAKEHGILMCIYSVIPSNTYDSQAIDPFNFKQKRTDYYIPQYDRLGLQPLYASAVDFQANDNSATLALGWQPRYSEYKTALDRNHGQFNQAKPLSSWTTSRARGYGINYLQGGLHLDEFKISPHLFDSIFSVEYNGKELTDPFFGTVNFNVMKVSNMDTDSLPNL